jgi:hypothetical protein
MILPPIFELGLVSVIASGVPGQEHILLRPTEPINLAQYGLMLGWIGQNGLVTPIPDHFYWFGVIEVRPPCWVAVYTGKGEHRVTKHRENGQPVYIFYWGKEATIFNIREMVPVAFRMNSITIGGHLKPPPSLAEMQQALQPTPSP